MTTAAQRLRQGLGLPIQMVTDREHQDFLVAAHAVALEQSGEIRQAMVRLAQILPRRDGEMSLIHQWLPDLVRSRSPPGTCRWRSRGAGVRGGGGGGDPAGEGGRGQPAVPGAARV